MSTETTINGYQILIVTERPDNNPPLAVITDRAGVDKRVTAPLLDLQIRMLRERLAIYEQVMGMLQGVQHDNP